MSLDFTIESNNAIVTAWKMGYEEGKLQAALTEREECAKIADEAGNQQIAELIRARK